MPAHANGLSLDRRNRRGERTHYDDGNLMLLNAYSRNR